jgi:predicted transcriptional regulator
METKPKTNSFGTFLETIHYGSTSRRGPVKDSLKLWSAIVASRPVTVSDLMRDSEMDFTTFAEALEALREAELIVLTGRPGQETVELTSYGEQVAGATP